MTLRPARSDDIPRIRQIEVAAGAVFRTLGMDAVAGDTPPSAMVLTGFVDRRGAWVVTRGERSDGGTTRGERSDGGMTGEDDVPIAFLLDEPVDGEPHLSQVSVHPDHAGHGHGRRLVEHLVERARAAGHTGVTLTTFVDVPWNGPYYARLGFRTLADDDLGPGLRAIRRTEIARGLDRWPRCAMRRDL